MNKNIEVWEMIIFISVIVLFIVSWGLKVNKRINDLETISTKSDTVENIPLPTNNNISDPKITLLQDSLVFEANIIDYRMQGYLDSNNILTIYDPNIIVKYDTLNWNNKKPGK